MRKALSATLVAVAILILAAPANRAAAQSGAVTPARYWRHHHVWAWHAPYWSPRRYWYADPAPYAHYYTRPPYWNPNSYNQGPYWGSGGYINSWYM
jgi:hypothetical protein